MTGELSRSERALDMDENRLLKIYLDDHAALALIAREVVGRMLGSSAHEQHAELLAQLGGEIDDDRDRIAQCLAERGARPSRVKSGAAWLAEKAGRLKLNGSVTAPSPLTPLVELEGLLLALEGHRALWRALERTASDGARPDFGARADRVERRCRQLEELRLRAAEAVL